MQDEGAAGARRPDRRQPLSGGSSARSSTTAAASASTGAEDASTSESSTQQLYARLVRHGGASVRQDDLAAMLSRLPSSPKDLFQRIERQRDEIRLLQEENVRLKSREVEVSSLTLKLQQQFAATQGQVEGIKAQIQLQLSNQITEAEYNAMDALPEDKRDLLDTIKLGIYRQLSSLRASTVAATKRAAELASASSRLTEENRDLKLQLDEARAVLAREQDTRSDRVKAADKQAGRIVELEATVKDMEAKLRNAFLDREQFLTAKLNAQVKTDEAARLAVRNEEAEIDVQRYRANAECNEQKLDILKSEYYELKLTYSQRVLELESCLKAADEKLKTLGDLELESELFISTLAQRERGVAGGGVEGTVLHPHQQRATAAGSSIALLEGTASTASAYESYMALPRSRKLAHSLIVTKRCLHLENKVSSLEHDVAFKDKQITRLQVSLEAARSALTNVNSPYAMVEKTLDDLSTENEQHKNRIKLLQEEKQALAESLAERTADVKVLCRHRQELLRMRKLLKQLGVAEGYTFDESRGLSPTDYGGIATSQTKLSRSGHQSSSAKARDGSQTATTASALAGTPAAAQPPSEHSASLRQKSAVAFPGIEISY